MTMGCSLCLATPVGHVLKDHNEKRRSQSFYLCLACVDQRTVKRTWRVPYSNSGRYYVYTGAPHKDISIVELSDGDLVLMGLIA